MNRWEKIIYKETEDKVNVIQGEVEDLGDFLEITGSYKKVLVNKKHVVSRTIKQASEENERK